MIVNSWIEKAYFRMEAALTRCGISKEEVASYVDKAREGFCCLVHLQDGTYGEFETGRHTTDAVRHMYRIAKAEAAKRGVSCISAAFGPLCIFIAAGTAKGNG